MRWCGHAYGRLARGRLEDPRLDLLCTTSDGHPVAFAWFEPGNDTSYVALRQDGFVEIYDARAHFPLRIATTTGIDLATSSATFDVDEYDEHGTLIRSSMMDARVAG
jgi:hypothetical protein